MVDGLYLRVLEDADSILRNFPTSKQGVTFLLGLAPGWEITRNDSATLLIEPFLIPTSSPSKALFNVVDDSLPRMPFGQLTDESIEEHLKIIYGAGNGGALASRLRDAPFMLHYYQEEVDLEIDEISMDTVLTPLRGGLRTKLIHHSGRNVVQQASVGGIVVGGRHGFVHREAG